MSERMIELQRARLLAAGKGNRSASNSNGASSASPVRQTPQEAATVAMMSEDDLVDRFAHRLYAQRDDARTASASAPTVPTALSRRILHQQGAGYLDTTVAAVVSAAGDRFLATVLQQALACRNQRLKGAELVRGAQRSRQLHMETYDADVQERRKRKLERKKKQTAIYHNAIQAALVLKKLPPPPPRATGDGDAASSNMTKKRKKKVDEAAAAAAAASFGSRLHKYKEEDEEASYDSLDEEEEYYRQYFGPGVTKKLNPDDEEEDEMLILRDLARPLEAWDFHVTGKYGMQPAEDRPENEDESDEDIDLDDKADADDLDDDEAGDDEDGDDLDGKMSPIPKSDKKKTASPGDSKPKSPAPTPTPEAAKD
jgi:hypothetical protein